MFVTTKDTKHTKDWQFEELNPIGKLKPGDRTAKGWFAKQVAAVFRVFCVFRGSDALSESSKLV